MSTKKSHFAGKRERSDLDDIEQAEEGNCWIDQMLLTKTTYCSTSFLALSCNPAMEFEDRLDQLRALLLREVRYGREDYIGCFPPEEDDLPIVDGDGCSSEARQPAVGCKSATSSIYSRRAKQSKTRENSSVHSRGSTTVIAKKSAFSEQHRARLCEWAIEVVSYYNFPMLSVEVTMNILDRYLAKHVPPEKRSMDTLHLFTLTSLYLALKLTTSERPPPHIFVRLSRSKFTTRQVEEAELQLIQGLDWHINAPTAETFAHYFIEVLAGAYPENLLKRVEIATIASIRTTVADYVWVRFSPSVVALGALSLCLHQESMGGLPDRYPSPLAELHQLGIFVDQRGSMQCLEYLYVRAMYASVTNNEIDRPRQLREQEARALFTCKHENNDSGCCNNKSSQEISPVSILKHDTVVVIADEVD